MRSGNAEQVDVSREVQPVMARHAQTFSIPELLRVIRIFNAAANDARSAWQPSLPLELAFVEALENPAAAPASQPVQLEAAPAARPASLVSPRPAGRPVQDASAPEASDLANEPRAEAVEEGGLSSKKITDHWRQILVEVRKRSPAAQGLLNSGKLVGVKDGALYLGFFSDVVKSKMEKGENIDILRQVLKQVLEMDVPVRCVVIKGRGPSLPPDVDGDGMVAAALRDLGGEIVDIQ
jgi:DNA polymerase-3 subunit gamma/tau